MNKKIGIALGGGVARVLAHIGVLEVLEKEGIPIDMIGWYQCGGCHRCPVCRRQGCQHDKRPGFRCELEAASSPNRLGRTQSGAYGHRRLSSGQGVYFTGQIGS